MEKTAIFNKDLLDVELVYIHLKKTDNLIIAMYKGSTLIGFLNDFEKIAEQNLPDILINIVPRNINELDRYKIKFKDRVEYNDNVLTEEYYFISEEEFYKSKILT